METKKRGRPPLHKTAMTGAERIRRWRDAKKRREYQEKCKHEHAERERKIYTCEQCGKVYQLSRYIARPWQYRFCSEYCRYCSTLKNPPKKSREEWEADWNAKQAERMAEAQKEFDRFFGGGADLNKYGLADPEADKNQEKLFTVLETYFNYFEDPNRRLHAIQNMIKKLKKLGIECQIEIA